MNGVPLRVDHSPGPALPEAGAVPSPRRWRFLVFLLLWAGGWWGVTWSVDEVRSRSVVFEDERLRKVLGDAATTVAATYDRLEWFRLQCRSWERLTVARTGRPAGRSWSATTLAAALVRRFPQARAMVFDGGGRLIFPAGGTGRRSWEILWAGLVAGAGGSGGYGGEAGRAEARRRARSHCKALFGGMTDLEDLGGPGAGPRLILRRGVRVVSWALPVSAPGGSGPAGGRGGLWLLLDEERIPAPVVGAWALRRLPPAVRHAAIVREDRPWVRRETGVSRRHPWRQRGSPSDLVSVGSGFVVETRARGRLPPRSAMHRLARGWTRVVAGGVAWTARYIPGEHGRWVVLGMPRPPRAGLGRIGWSWVGVAGLAAAVLLLAGAHRVWWCGLPLGLGLTGRVAGIFLGLAVVPLVLVTWLGFDRVEDAGRRERIRWEHRMQSLFAGMEESFGRYLDARQDWCDRQERALQALVVASASSETLRGALEDLRGVGGAFDAILLTSSGQEVRRKGRFPCFHEGRTFQTFLRQALGQVLSEKGQPIPPRFTSDRALVAGNSLDQVTHFLVKSNVRGIHPYSYEGYPLYQRVVILTDPDSGRVHGLLSWFFDGAALAYPSLAQGIARLQGSRAFTPAEFSDLSAVARHLRTAPGPLGEAVRGHLAGGAAGRWLDPAAEAGLDRDDLDDLVEALNRFLLAVWPPAVEADRPGGAGGVEQEPVLDRVAGHRRHLEAWLGPVLAPAGPAGEAAGALRLCGVAPDGGWQPAHLVPSEGLEALVTRARVTRAFESDLVDLDGREVLATAFSPYRFNGYRLVAVVDRRELERGRGFLLGLMGMALLLGVGFLGGAATGISRRLLARVERLRRLVAAVGQGEFAARVEDPGQDELSHLAVTFNSMAEGLQQRERLRQFVSEKVWERTQEDPEQGLALGGQELQVAVLFSRLQGCDDLLERYPPEEVVGFLQEYHTGFEAAVREHHGWIDKFIGDQVMAVFDPIPGYPSPGSRAVAAARRMQEISTGFDRARQAAGRFGVRTDIGIHGGPVIAGNVGSAARQGQLAFTVMGDTVNTAARLLGVAEKQGAPAVVVSEAVRHAASEAAFRPLERISLKGKSEPLALYQLVEGEAAPSGRTPAV